MLSLSISAVNAVVSSSSSKASSLPGLSVEDVVRELDLSLQHHVHVAFDHFADLLKPGQPPRLGSGIVVRLGLRRLGDCGVVIGFRAIELVRDRSEAARGLPDQAGHLDDRNLSLGLRHLVVAYGEIPYVKIVCCCCRLLFPSPSSTWTKSSSSSSCAASRSGVTLSPAFW